MRLEARLTVKCDRCKQTTTVVGLQETLDGWDDRYVNDELADQGWALAGGEDVCPDCVRNGPPLRVDGQYGY